MSVNYSELIKKNIEELSQKASKKFIILISYLLYCLITALSVKDINLILKNQYVKMPILNLSLPIMWFFVGGQILGIIIYVYLNVYQMRLKNLLEEYDYKAIERKFLYPSLLNIYLSPDKGFLGKIQKISFKILMWIFPFLVSLVMASVYIKSHSPYGVYLINIFPLIFGLFSLYFWLLQKEKSLSFKKNKQKKKRVKAVLKKNYGKAIFVMYMIFNLIYLSIFAYQGLKGNSVYYSPIIIDIGILNVVDLSDKIISKKDLSTKQKYWVDLENAQLQGAILNNAYLKKANFRRANLKRALMAEVNLSEANLQGANLEEANLTNANISSTNMSMLRLVAFSKGKKVKNREFKYATILRNADLRWADLKNSNLSYVNLKGANLETARLNNVNLSKATLDKSNLTSANLENSDLTEASFIKTNLTNANLAGCDVSFSHFEGANFSWSNLFGLKFSFANLEGAFFYKTYSEGVTFSFSKLEGAYFYKAHLYNSFFFTRHVMGANFDGCFFGKKNLYSFKVNKNKIRPTLLNKLLMKGFLVKINKNVYKWNIKKFFFYKKFGSYYYFMMDLFKMRINTFDRSTLVKYSDKKIYLNKNLILPNEIKSIWEEGSLPLRVNIALMNAKKNEDDYKDLLSKFNEINNNYTLIKINRRELQNIFHSGNNIFGKVGKILKNADDKKKWLELRKQQLSELKDKPTRTGLKKLFEYGIPIYMQAYYSDEMKPWSTNKRR